MRWGKTGCTVTDEGTTITYELRGCPLRIESRKRHIPHANGVGTWDHTSFVILRGDEVIDTKLRLQDAQRLAERYVLNRGLIEEDAAGRDAQGRGDISAGRSFRASARKPERREETGV